MNIPWPILAVTVLATGLSHLWLVRRLQARRREMARLEDEHRIMSRELLQARAQFAEQMEEARALSAKRIAGLQANVNDLAALVKERRSTVPPGTFPNANAAGKLPGRTGGDDGNRNAPALAAR